jgi:hypothetical protein
MKDNRLYRDPESTAVLNTDFDALHAYKIKRSNNTKIKELENDINTVKEELTEIKNMLQLLITRG